MPVQRTCKHCHKAFVVKPHVVNRGQGIYCSLECRAADKKGKLISSTERVCETCGKTFYAKPSQVARFCSKACYHAAPSPCALPLEVRFWRHVEKTDGCWLWTGTVMDNGYGIMGREDGGSRLASRISWELHNGPIPDGMKVCHTCDNRRCVNPAHLFLGTHQDNMDDMVNKGRQTTGERNGQAKLTDDDVRRIRAMRRSGTPARVIAEQFSIHENHVYSIARRASWKHVP